MKDGKMTPSEAGGIVQKLAKDIGIVLEQGIFEELDKNDNQVLTYDELLPAINKVHNLHIIMCEKYWNQK